MNLAVLHQDLAVDNDGVDVAAEDLVDEAMDHHPVRCQMGLAHVDDGDVGLLAGLQRADLVIHLQCVRRAQRDGRERLSDRDALGLTQDPAG